jgi:hypothetical protein
MNSGWEIAPPWAQAFARAPGSVKIAGRVISREKGRLRSRPHSGKQPFSGFILFRFARGRDSVVGKGKANPMSNLLALAEKYVRLETEISGVRREMLAPLANGHGGGDIARPERVVPPTKARSSQPGASNEAGRVGHAD